MRTTAFFVAAALLSGPLGAQEQKPVPKDSVRVFVPGCSKGKIFTAAARTEDTGGPPVPEGMHLRMSGPKTIMAEIKGVEGSRIELTGLMRKGQYAPGVSVGGVRISGGPAALRQRAQPGRRPGHVDVEGWRACPAGPSR